MPTEAHSTTPADSAAGPLSRTTFAERVARGLIRWRWVGLALAIVLAGSCLIPASRIQMDRSLISMFAPDDPLLPPYNHLREVFGGNDFVLLVYNDPEIWNEDESGYNRLIEVRDRVEKLEGVKGVLSLDMPLGDRILNPEFSVAVKLRRMLRGYTHGADGETVSVACMLYPESETDVPRKTTIEDLRAIAADLPGGLPPGTVAGEPVMINDAFAYVDEDGRRLFYTTTVLLALVILFCFRSLRWVIIPIAVVQLALLLTNGLLGVLQIRLSMVSSMLTAVVTVIGVATVVHVIVRFREARQTGLGTSEALAAAGRRLVAPVFWACTTDAVGFAALLAAHVGPIRDFGLMMAIGSMMVLISAALLVPALVLWGRRDTDPQGVWGEQALDARLGQLITLVLNRPVLVGCGALVASLIAIYGVRWLTTETDFTRNFRSTTPIVQSYELVEEKLGGAGVSDIVLPAPSHLNWEFLVKVLLFEQRLRTEVGIPDENGELQPGLTKVLSLADIVVGAIPKMPRNRLLRQAAIGTGLTMMHRRIPVFYDALYTGNDSERSEHYFRILLRANERQSAEDKQSIIAQVRRITKEEFPDAEYSNVHVTGYFVLLTSLIDSILRDQWRTFAIALGGILLTMALALRSIRLAFVATIPNAIPILVVNGMIGWLGMPMNMGAAMIAAVSIGLSIDGSIHYLMGYQRARSEGKTNAEALFIVQQTVGRAMVLSTLALIVGFAALATSQFIPTVYFGVLVSFSMLGTLVGNLVWLPLLLRLFAPRTVASAATHAAHTG